MLLLMIQLIDMSQDKDDDTLIIMLLLTKNIIIIMMIRAKRVSPLLIITEQGESVIVSTIDYYYYYYFVDTTTNFYHDMQLKITLPTVAVTSNLTNQGYTEIRRLTKGPIQRLRVGLIERGEGEDSKTGVTTIIRTILTEIRPIMYLGDAPVGYHRSTEVQNTDVQLMQQY